MYVLICYVNHTIFKWVKQENILKMFLKRKFRRIFKATALLIVAILTYAHKK